MKQQLYLSISKKIVMLFLSILSLQVKAQLFDIDTLVYNGDINKRINLVILADGYTNNDLSQFASDASNLSTYLFSISPYNQYKNYFNVFAVKVISAQSGASHPGTATDVTEPVIPVVSVNNYLGSTFDYYDVHRLLVSTNDAKIYSVLADNFPLYDQVLIVVNSQEYGGSGGDVATISINSNANEIAAHEIGHSFGNLGDEYWNGTPEECPNMTTQGDTTLVKWKNWLGMNQVGVYPYGSTSPQSEWFKPHESCKMQYLGYEYCSVCKEALIERIHSLTNPIDSYQPTNTGVINASTGLLTFTYNQLKPFPNTLKSTWKLNTSVIANNGDSVLINDTNFVTGNNTVMLTVIDTNTFSKAVNHIADHTFSVVWNVNKTLTEKRELNTITTFYTYPNPTSNGITVKYTLSKQSQVSFAIMNSDGKIVKNSTPKNQASGDYQEHISLEEIPSGQYYLQSSIDNRVVLDKIVITK